MYKVEYLPSAMEELENIQDWYAYKFDNKTAKKVSDSIMDIIDRLEMVPNSGSPTPDDVLNSIGYRMVITGGYVAIYRLIDETVLIYHIASTKTEYTKLFK